MSEKHSPGTKTSLSLQEKTCGFLTIDSNAVNVTKGRKVISLLVIWLCFSC